MKRFILTTIVLFILINIAVTLVAVYNLLVARSVRLTLSVIGILIISAILTTKLKNGGNKK